MPSIPGRDRCLHVGAWTASLALGAGLVLLARPSAAEPRPAENLIGTVLEIRTPDPGVVGLARGDFRGLAFPELPDFTAPAEGSFALSAAAGRDVRRRPRLLRFTAPDGSLVARITDTAVPRRLDPASGRPLAPDAAPDAVCASGTEPGCQPGAAAPPANQLLFDLLCDADRGFSSLDPSACPLDVFRSQSFAALPFGSLAQLLSLILSGSPQGVATVSNPAFLGPAGRIPLVALSIDPADAAKNGSVTGGGPSGFFAPFALDPDFRFALPGFAANHDQFQTLAQVLTPAQQALAGCGPFLDTACDGGADQSTPAPAAGGLDLARSEAAALLQSFAPLGDLDFRADDASIPQPGTVGSEVAACARTASGVAVTLAGCRAAGETGFDPASDGGDPGAVHIGFAAGVAGVPPLGSPALGPIAFTRGHPFTGQAWRSELAALSWNLQMLLVAFSDQVSDPATDPVSRFDPAAPYRDDGCSFVKPQLCSGVAGLLGYVATVPEDDPQGLPHQRWLWERGARARVESASGRFAAFRGGEVVHGGLVTLPPALGPARVQPAVLYAPLSLDADDDGVADAVDVCGHAFDPGQEDADGDGVGDACDVCGARFDPDQRDSDADGFGNACDADLDGDRTVNFGDLVRMRAAFFGTGPDADLDGNGVVDFRDLARLRRAFFQPPGPSALAQ